MKKIIGMVILYLLAFVIIVAAVFCGIRLYKEIKAESYINGSIDIPTSTNEQPATAFEPTDDSDSPYDKAALAKVVKLLGNDFILR